MQTQYGPDRIIVDNWLYKTPKVGIGAADILRVYKRKIGMPFKIFREANRTIYKFYQGFDLWTVIIYKKSS